MPEGDTVFRLATTLNTALAGAILTGCDIRVPAYATLDLSGEVLTDVASRGKHLLMHVGEYTVHSHLRMEGSWELYRPGARWRHPSYQARIVLTTAEQTAVGFRLGMLDVVPQERESEVVGHLGPDLLGIDWDPDEAVRRLAAHPDDAVAVALFDQRNLAGLGNEYVNELCFLRGMLPTRTVAQADLPATVVLAHRLIFANRLRAERTTTGDLRRGKRHWVYGRQNEPCLRCGTRIRRTEIGRNDLELRDLFFCPHCQS